jgi:hypothetical protein
MKNSKSGLIAGLIVYLIFTAFSASVFSQTGAGVTITPQTPGAVIPEQEDPFKSCKGLPPTEHAACMQKRSNEVLMKMHPCAAAMGGGCKGLTGDAYETCMKKYGADCGEKRAERQQKFMDNHPCAAAMVEKPCKGLMIAERAVCIKQEAAKCRAQRKEILKKNHPCAAPIVTRPCKDVAGEMARAACIDKQIAACQAKWAGQ